MLHLDPAPAPGPLVLDGRSLTIPDVVAVARQRRRVAIAPEAVARMARCRQMVELLVERGEKVYGLTTGFGKLRDVAIDPSRTEQLQENLIVSHAAGVGRPYPEDVVRAAILLRANTLCRGNSGMRPEVVQTFVDLLNDDVYPHVPEQGSVGCSGDLAPLSHVALFLMGHPQARWYRRSSDERALVTEPRDADFVMFPADFDAVAREQGWRSFRPVRLQAKEGLAANNGTQFMTGQACLALHDAWYVLRFGEMAAALSLEANRGVLDAYDDRLHAARDLPGQAACARRMRRYVEGSEILGLYLNSGYLLRARMDVAAATDHLEEVVAEWTAASPLIPRLRGGLEELDTRIAAVIPRLADGAPDEAELARLAALPVREQIAWGDAHLAEVRREASALLRQIQAPDFPDTPARAKVEEAIVRCVAHLRESVPRAPLVQDDYSFRCFPQVAACAWRALEHVAAVVEVEINAATDNPLLFPPEPPVPDMEPAAYRAWLAAEAYDECRRGVLGGGNFHGEPIAIGMDYLAIAMAEIGNIAERRVAHLVDEAVSRGLPGFLIEATGLNSGFMIPQYTAAALVSENKVLCHPASVDSIPTCANSEDHNSMGSIAARKGAAVVANVRRVVAIELLSAFQGLSFRRPLRPGPRLRRLVAALEAGGLCPLEADAVMAPLLARAEALLADPAVRACLLDEPPATGR
jgi:histidine ammonia-lyase